MVRYNRWIYAVSLIYYEIEKFKYLENRLFKNLAVISLLLDLGAGD